VHEDAIANLRISSLAPGIVDTGMQADIRASSAEDFPDIALFRDLKTSGQLATPAATAARIVDVLLSDSFGQNLVSDIRDQ
jgi:NAD(P)-dependent dehydrogenase (short-subunit alcohol dehydrogenase family)